MRFIHLDCYWATFRKEAVEIVKELNPDVIILGVGCPT